MSELQLNDWYDLRDHVIEISESHIKFLFSLYNAPSFNDEVIERLKTNFGEITIETPIDQIYGLGPLPDIRHTGEMYVTLKFKSKDLRHELLNSMKLLQV